MLRVVSTSRQFEDKMAHMDTKGYLSILASWSDASFRVDVAKRLEGRANARIGIDKESLDLGWLVVRRFSEMSETSQPFFAPLLNWFIASPKSLNNGFETTEPKWSADEALVREKEAVANVLTLVHPDYEKNDKMVRLVSNAFMKKFDAMEISRAAFSDVSGYHMMYGQMPEIFDHLAKYFQGLLPDVDLILDQKGYNGDREFICETYESADWQCALKVVNFAISMNDKRFIPYLERVVALMKVNHLLPAGGQESFSFSTDVHVFVLDKAVKILQEAK